MSDHFNLNRFLRAQEGIFDVALSEVSKGRKRSHWMWFVLPQLRGLGTSEMAHLYGLTSLDEARAYLLHPILGERLKAIVQALQDLEATSAVEVLGPVDAIKLRSSLTLFSEADGGPLFQAALDRWFAGEPDLASLKLISSGSAR
jgi:uncharacterized protein (DUF1810 family)